MPPEPPTLPPDSTPVNGDAAGDMLDARVLRGDDVTADELKAALRSPTPPQGELLRSFAERLLAHALQARDADAALIVAHLMDTDPALDAAFYGLLNDALYLQPDAVYAFVRARMAESPDARWGERLRVAAVASLGVAITDGDCETAANWLRLLAREPAVYNLGDIVYGGMLAAQERARHDPELARVMIGMATRRVPTALDILLNDAELLAAIPNNLGRVLRDLDGDPLTLLPNYGVEVFMVALLRGARARAGRLFTAASIDQAWALYTAGQPINAPATYQPERLIQLWLAEGIDWLDEAAQIALLTNALRDRRDDLFLPLARHIADRPDFLPLVVTALQRSGRGESEVLALIGQLAASGDLNPQHTADAYATLLTAWDWHRTALPMMQQLARTLQQHPPLEAAPETLWRMVEAAADAKDELTARVAARRLMTELEAGEDDLALPDSLLRLHTLLAWNATLRGVLVNWWRAFVRGATLARLQRIDKALDGKRGLDDLRPILGTVIALRKMIGKRSLQQFAADVSVTYAILQALAESFDPSPKRGVNFDPTTVRAEMDARVDELSPHERQILANNFKELAQLIAGMGDNRSKASPFRRGDDVDRQLMTGDQQPHSAVDTLKWLAGYLGGTQEKDEERDED